MVSVDVQKIVDGSFYWADGQFQSIGVNPSYGSGQFLMARPLQRGISILIQDFSLYGDGDIRLTGKEAEPPLVAFFSCFSGVGQIYYAKPRVLVGGGISNIEYADYKPIRFMDVMSNTPIRTVCICVDPMVFFELTGKSSDTLVEELDFLDSIAGEPSKLARSKSISFAQRVCGYQLLDSFVNNPHDTLFLEAKALELISMQLKQLELLTGKKPQKQTDDCKVEKISCACDILKKEMRSPPNALDLARRVGLNHKLLVQGFKEMFGVKPFEYLRIIRLETARDLIASHECNITEAAFNVGYSSLSHFCKSFREEFGINPKACAQTVSRAVPIEYRAS